MESEPLVNCKQWIYISLYQISLRRQLASPVQWQFTPILLWLDQGCPPRGLPWNVHNDIVEQVVFLYAWTQHQAHPTDDHKFMSMENLCGWLIMRQQDKVCFNQVGLGGGVGGVFSTCRLISQWGRDWCAGPVLCTQGWRSAPTTSKHWENKTFFASEWNLMKS